MIVGLEGKIVKKEPTLIHINVMGVVYEVHISLNCYSNITNDNIYINIVHIIREDSQTLYGFLDNDEKKMFLELIKISGIGGKVALAICSTFLPSVFAKILNTKDVNLLKKVPGLGPKNSNRILIEMSNFIVEDSNISKSQAIMALETLGFKKDDIINAISDSNSTEVGDIIKDALKKLQKF
jgi:Holliday junction DNA helicase RuvA